MLCGSLLACDCLAGFGGLADCVTAGELKGVLNLEFESIYSKKAWPSLSCRHLTSTSASCSMRRNSRSGEVRWCMYWLLLYCLLFYTSLQPSPLFLVPLLTKELQEGLMLQEAGGLASQPAKQPSWAGLARVCQGP